MSEDQLLSPIPCTTNVLASFAAIASQYLSPVPPYVFLSGTGQCGGQGGSTTGSIFPQYYFASDCSSSGVPTYANNCLRIISNFDGSFDPLKGPALSPNQVNVLPGGTDQNGNPANNVFSTNDARLYSWYAPPGYSIYFFKLNPMTHTRDQCAAGGYLKTDSNQLMVDACLSNAKLSDGSAFFFYGSNDPYFGTPQPPSCLQAYCSCGLDQTFSAGPSYCQETTKSINPCPGTTHQAPYFIVVQNEDFANIIREMCVNNRQVTIGPDSPDNSLNRVWKPQTASCDNYMTNLCNISDLTQSRYAEQCACFTQQQALNNQYGAALKVPVVCFGQDPSGNIAKSCAFDEVSYKTSFMLSNACSFAECQTIVSQSPEMQVHASPPGQIQCNNNFVNFPPVYPSPTGPIPTVIITDIVSIPFFVWLVLGLGVLLLVLFVIVLSFV
jgi:hypothetical protein